MPFYSQLRQLPCPRHVMTIPTHLLLSHLLLLAQNLSSSKQMLSKLLDGYTHSSVVKGLTCKRGCDIAVACTLLLNKAHPGSFIDFQLFLTLILCPLSPSPPSLSLFLFRFLLTLGILTANTSRSNWPCEPSPGVYPLLSHQPYGGVCPPVLKWTSTTWVTDAQWQRVPFIV